MTDTIDNPSFARAYVRSAARADRRGAAGHRARLLERLAGTVLEVGAGHGANFAHYPPGVERVIAVEPNPALREHALRAAAAAPVDVQVVGGVADRLPLGDATVDAAVASLVLCSVPDQAAALAELRRVVRPGGELRFYEHVIPRRQPLRAVLQLADRSGLWPRVAGGCHPARDTAAAIAAAGFEITALERFGFSASALEPALPYVLGVARR